MVPLKWSVVTGEWAQIDGVAGLSIGFKQR